MSGMGCMVSQPLIAGGNRSCPEFWVVTDDLQYPGYNTLTTRIRLHHALSASTLAAPRRLIGDLLWRGWGHGDSLLFSPIFLGLEVEHGARLSQQSIGRRIELFEGQEWRGGQ
jgi:hypothetical protein